MQNEVEKEAWTLKKSFINFTLRNFHELNKTTLEAKKICQSWHEYKKYGVEILKQILSREKDAFYPFQNFLIYQMPFLIVKSKTKNKKQYFQNLEEIIQEKKIQEHYFTKKNKLQIKQEKKNYLTLIGRKIRKLAGNGLTSYKYYGKKQIKEFIKKIAQDNQIKLYETDKIKQIITGKLIQQGQNQNKKKKLEIMIEGVNQVLHKIIVELKDEKEREQL